jgi:hypothetical protein
MGPAIGAKNLGAALLPAIQRGSVAGATPGPLTHTFGIGAATAFGLSVWSHHRAEGLLWIKYVASLKNQQAYLSQVGLPARLGVKFAAAEKQSPALADIENLITKHAGVNPVYYEGFKTQNAIQSQFEDFFSNSTTPSAAAAAFEQAQSAP